MHLCSPGDDNIANMYNRAADLWHTVSDLSVYVATPYYSPSSKKPAAKDRTTKMSQLTLILAMSVCRQSFAEANICTVFSGLGHLLQHTNLAI